jgi:hypothetical protein
MIKKIAGVIALIIVAVNFSFAQDAARYLGLIGKEFDKISNETWDYTRAVAHGGKAKLIENKRHDMLNANRLALTRIKKMDTYKGDGSYRDSIVKYLELNYAILNNDYSKIVDMEEVAEQSYDAMEAYMTAQQMANEKLDAAFEIVQNAQKDFAKKNNIILQDADSETGEKLEKAGEVFKYYNQIYLIFFKPYKQEAYLIAAQNKSDINGIKQNQDALLNLSKEAKIKLMSVKPYKNNTAVKNSCDHLLDFYITEAETKVSQLVDFFLKKEKFDKLKATIEKKGANASKTEVDEYNKAIAEYNKASNNSNKINDELNKKRDSLLSDWNNSVSKLLDRNISKQK